MQNPKRLPVIDALKVLAAQAIVLHHFALYGPMSTYARPLAPHLIDALAEHGRLAVQVFLVIGGFLAARTLAPDGKPTDIDLMKSLGKRWLRLGSPYWIALLLALLAGAIARDWVSLPHTPAAPSLSQVLANALMLQDIVGLPALSAGFWYVAIDLQLFALMLILMWSLRRIGLQAGAILVVTLSTAASLLLFNIDPTWDAWGLYFFGAYGLGALAWWSAASQAPSPRRWLLLVVIAGLTIISLIALWRSRIALAGITACVLALCSGPASARYARSAPRALAWLSDRSYALFLVHYPVCLVFNAAAQRWLPHTPGVQALALFAAWVASMLASHVLYTRVERPAGAWFNLNR
jgi:peptidoglycan/LPS O-acetylase OafA/YrhL